MVVYIAECNQFPDDAATTNMEVSSLHMRHNDDFLGL